MKRLVFWIVVGIVAVNLCRREPRAHADRGPSRMQLVELGHDSGREVPNLHPRHRVWVEGLPVPIVPETRVTEAVVAPPVHRRGPRHHTSIARAQAPPAEARKIIGRLSATEPRARDDARVQLERAVADWIGPDVPRSWKPPARLVDAMVRETRIQPVIKEYGTLYEATLRADFSPKRRETIVRAYERELVARRLAVLGGGLGFVLICLGAVAGYIQADEATKGYYTNRLRLVAAAGIGAAGVAIYRILT